MAETRRFLLLLGFLAGLQIVHCASDGGNRKLSSEVESELTALTESLSLVREAYDLLLSSQQDSAIVTGVRSRLSQAMRYTTMVSDSFLVSINYELKDNYRDYFCSGLSAGLFCYEHGDTDSCNAAQTLMNRWGQWYEANVGLILDYMESLGGELK